MRLSEGDSPLKTAEKGICRDTGEKRPSEERQRMESGRGYTPSEERRGTHLARERK